jgi:hypothetical protein
VISKLGFSRWLLLALGDHLTIFQCRAPSQAFLYLLTISSNCTHLDLGMGNVDWAVQPVALAVQPLVHSVCTIPEGLPGVSERFHRSLPGRAPGRALAASHHCPCPGVLVVLRIHGLFVDTLRGGPLLPDLFPWMPVMPRFLSSRALLDILRLLFKLLGGRDLYASCVICIVLEVRILLVCFRSRG